MTVEQRTLALARANHIRLARAALKRALSSHSTQAESLRACADAVESPPPELETMAVGALLASCRRSGVIFAATLLRRAKVPAGLKVGTPGEWSHGFLTAAQRERLVLVLRGQS